MRALHVLLISTLSSSSAFALDKGLAANSTPAIHFRKQKIKVGTRSITAEIADNDDLREHGLMFRTKLPDNEGMLFVFPEPHAQQFWMKDTLIPLSIGFFDKDKKLFDTKEMVPAVVGAMMPTIYASNGDAMYALEMPKGWFTKHGIKSGAKLSYIDEPEKPAHSGSQAKP